jgi:glutaredoxin
MLRIIRRLGLLVVTGALLLISGWSVPAGASSPTGPIPLEAVEWGPTDLVLFWGDGCPHCEDERQWLEEARADYPELTVHEYEVWFDEGNRALLMEVAGELGFEPSGVPVTVLGDRYWVGWSEVVQAELTTQIEVALAEEAGAEGSAAPAEPTGTTVDVPLFGPVALGESLIASTLIIGFVDGVNPCSLWVITVLLAIVVRTGARGRVIAIGTTYLVVTALMYGLFIMGVYSALGLVSHLGAVHTVVALVAGVLGAISVKDYFAFRQGVSMTISDAAKPGLYHRMRSAAGHERLLPALGATVVLAVGVSFIEIPCTAGFPLLWAGILEANDVGFVQALGLLVLFMVPYLLDELIVFGVAVFTMRSLKLQERHGRLLKLVAGTMMIALAVTVLLAPEAMTRPVLALLVFAAAIGAAVVIHLVMRRVRPEEFAAPPERTHHQANPADLRR